MTEEIKKAQAADPGNPDRASNELARRIKEAVGHLVQQGVIVISGTAVISAPQEAYIDVP